MTPHPLKTKPTRADIGEDLLDPRLYPAAAGTRVGKTAVDEEWPTTDTKGHEGEEERRGSRIEDRAERACRHPPSPPCSFVPLPSCPFVGDSYYPRRDERPRSAASSRRTGRRADRAGAGRDRA